MANSFVSSALNKKVNDIMSDVFDTSNYVKSIDKSKQTPFAAKDPEGYAEVLAVTASDFVRKNKGKDIEGAIMDRLLATTDSQSDVAKDMRIKYSYKTFKEKMGDKPYLLHSKRILSEKTVYVAWVVNEMVQEGSRYMLQAKKSWQNAVAKLAPEEVSDLKGFLAPVSDYEIDPGFIDDHVDLFDILPVWTKNLQRLEKRGNPKFWGIAQYGSSTHKKIIEGQYKGKSLRNTRLSNLFKAVRMMTSNNKDYEYLLNYMKYVKPSVLSKIWSQYGDQFNFVFKYQFAADTDEDLTQLLTILEPYAKQQFPGLTDAEDIIESIRIKAEAQT